MKNKKTGINKIENLKNEKLSVVIGILGIILAILLIVIVSDLSRGHRPIEARDVSSMSYYLSRGMYTEIARGIKTDRRNDAKIANPKEYDKFAAIGDYYYNAFYYYSCIEGGGVGADRYYERMEDAKSRMGEYIFAQEEIDSKINTFISKQNTVN